MNSKGFFYENPEAAYLMTVVLLLIALYIYLKRERSNFLRRYAVDAVLERVIGRRSSILFVIKALFVCAAWILATYALMDPKGNARYPDELLASLNKDNKEQTLRRRPHEVAFVLDTSRSMDVKDMRTGQTRLDFAKEIIDEVIRGLKGETISIYTFTAAGSKVVPSTLDYIYSRLLLKSLTSNDEGVGGTNLKGALQKVMEDFTALPNSTLKTIVLLSDGEDLHYSDLGEAEKNQFENELLATLGNVKAENLRLFAVGMGTKEGGTVPLVRFKGNDVKSTLDESLLKKLAAKGRGEYFQGNRYSSQAIAASIIKSMNQDNPYKPLYEIELNDKAKNDKNDYIYDRYYQSFLAAAIILLALALILPERWYWRRDGR
jgi:Ca-activated chloride channel family protein